MITAEALHALCPKTPFARVSEFVEPVNVAMEQFGITKVPEFLAQIAHESGGFVYVKELWGPTPQQAKYEGRADLGNTEPGDGFRFRGRGLIQITGRANYEACGEALDLPLTHQPELLERPMIAARSAGWFWQSNGCNAIDDFKKLTRKINGGLNGYDERLAYLARAMEVA